MAYPDFSAAFSAVAGVSVSGVTIYTMANRPDMITVREGSVLVPVSATSPGEEPASMGLAGGALYQSRFTVNYFFMYAPIGSNRITGYMHDQALQKLTALIAAIKSADTTLSNIERITLAGCDAMGTVEDPAGNPFLGCSVSFNIWQIDQ